MFLTFAATNSIRYEKDFKNDPISNNWRNVFTRELVGRRLSVW